MRTTICYQRFTKKPEKSCLPCKYHYRTPTWFIVQATCPEETSAVSTAAVHEPRRIRILLVLRMSLRIAALNNGNILSCSDQRISELYKSVKSKSMPAIQVWRKAKMDHECSSWPTEAPTRLIQLIGLKAKIQKLTQNHKSAGKKDEVSAVSQLSPRHPHKGHTHGVRASPDKHSHHLPWLDHAISCVSVWVCAWQVDGLDSSEEKDGSANQGLQALHGETRHQKFLFKHLTHVQQKLHIEVQVFTIFVNSHGHC